MNISIINGSYHKDGATVSLIKSFIDGFKSIKKEVKADVFNLADITTEYCKGCSNCNKVDGRDLGECRIKDGTDKILRRMLESDLLVFASPVYEYAVTAVMKKFLERSMPILQEGKMGPALRNKKVKGKNGVVIVSSGAPFPINKITGITRYPLFILTKLLKAFSCDKVYRIASGGVQENGKATDAFIRKSYNLGVKLSHQMLSI